MADVAVPSIATATPAAADTVVGVQGGAVKRFSVSEIGPAIDFGYPATLSGVVADDLTDNSAALVTAAYAARDLGLPLILPAGTIRAYDVAIDAWDGLQIIGRGVGQTILKNVNTSGASLLTVRGASAVVKQEHIRLANFSLEGNEDSGHGLYIGNSDNGGLLGMIELEHIYSHHHGIGGVVLHGKLDQVLLRTVRARSNTGHGIAIGVTTYGDAATSLISEVVLQNVHANANTKCGVAWGGQCRVGVVIGGEFSHNSEYGIDQNSALGPSNGVNLTIIGSYFETVNAANTAQLRFGGTGSFGTTVQGCMFSDQTASGINGPALVVARAPQSTISFLGNMFGLKDGKYGIDLASGPATSVGTWMRQNRRSGGAALVRISGVPVTSDYNDGGPTANRPPHAAGRSWFDTTLGRPIWSNGTNWVDATGATV